MSNIHTMLLMSPLPCQMPLQNFPRCYELKYF